MGLTNFTNGNGSQPPIGSLGSQNGNTTDISEYVRNYNDAFKNADPILYRDEPIEETLSILIGQKKPNALLIGAAGTGKTAIVEEIARRIAVNDPIIPNKLKKSTIYELPLYKIVSGSSFQGQVEEKIESVIEFMENKKNDAILFIDELHLILGNDPTYVKIAQILKPSLARGSIRLIGATTLQESQNLMADPAFNRRLSPVIVDELTRDQTVEILKAGRASLVKHYENKVSISDDVLEICARMADEYNKSNAHRPDNAITLLDRTVGDTIMKRMKMELAATNNPTMLQAIKSVTIMPITESQLKTTAQRLLSGSSKICDFDETVITNALSRIKGQETVIPELITRLRKHYLSVYPKTDTDRKPLAFLFAGPSGVGKTEVSKILAKELTGNKPIILNMTEYHDPASINRIIGAPAGYVGYSEHSELPFDILESNPYQLIILDEFEKADSSVQKLFMGALSEGYITTSKGKTVDFSKAIIIATTNAAFAESKKNLGFVTDNSPSSIRTKVSDLSKWFDIALLNRFAYIFTFSELSADVYRDILIAKYKKDVELIRSTRKRVNLPDTIPDEDLDALIAETYVPAFGARPAEDAIKNYVENIAYMASSPITVNP